MTSTSTSTSTGTSTSTSQMEAQQAEAQAHAERMMMMQTKSSMLKMERDTMAAITKNEMEARGETASKISQGASSFKMN